MNTFMTWSGWTPLVQTLLHALWQSALIAIVMTLILSLLPAARSGTRYAVTLAALLLCLLSAAATFGILRASPGLPAEFKTADSSIHTSDALVQAGGPPADQTLLPLRPSAERTSFLSHQRAAALGTAWCAGCLLMFLRTTFLLIAARRIVRSAAPISDERLLNLLHEMRVRIGYRRTILLLQCEGLSSPAVTGFLKPAILLPASMLSGLTTEQLRLILAHELAHLKHEDFLVNIAQMLIECLFFFNPSVWWISRQVRREREACCDQIAARSGSRRSAYAAALADWAQSLPGKVPAPALAATGHDGALLDRVRRVIDPDHRPRPLLPVRALLGTLLFSVLALGTVIGGTGLAAQTVTEVFATHSRSELRFEPIQHPATITGTWHLPEGHPGFPQWKPNQSVRIVGIIRSQLMQQRVSGTAHADGTFEIRTPRESLEFLVTGDGFAPAQRRGRGTATADESFDVRTPRSTLELLVTGDGFAPTLAGPFELSSHELQSPIEVILTNGFPATLRLTDETGAGVAGAKVTLRAGEHRFLSHDFHYQTDDMGNVEIANAWPHAYQLSVRAEGFEEFVERQVRFQPNVVASHAMVPALSLAGRVLNDRGAPIPNARIRIASTSRDHAIFTGHPPEYEEHGELRAHSDEDGRFSLNTLERDLRYALIIQADGYAPHLVPEHRAGDVDLVVTLAKERSIVGRIHAREIPRLETLLGQPHIRVRQKLYFRPNVGRTISHFVPVEIDEHGVGTFRVDGLYAARTTIRTQSDVIEIGVLEEGVRHVDIAILSAAEEPCEVVITVQLPGDFPEPEGSLLVLRQRPGLQRLEEIRTPLTNSRATLRAAVGDRLFVTQGSMRGAWIQSSNPIDIGENQEDLSISVPALPAGKVHVRLEDPAVQPGESASRWALTVRASSGPAYNQKVGPPLPNNVLTDSDAETSLAPVPLHGRYTIIAMSGFRFMAQRDVVLNEQTPEAAITLSAGPMRDIVIRIADENDQPLADQAVSLEWRYEDRTFRRRILPRTDADGLVRFRNIPTESNGQYFIDLPERDIPSEQRIPLDWSVDIQTIVLLPASDAVLSGLDEE